MITKSIEIVQSSQAWQRILSEAIRDPAQLLNILRLPQGLLASAQQAASLFPLRVPQPFLQRIEPENPNDPLLRQVLPLAEELENQYDQHDAVGDLEAMVVPGLIHKYHGRALLTLTGACAVHCRYCFRRHFPYNASNPLSQHWQAIIDFLGKHDEIEEIILSGGDPLSLSTDKLRNLGEDLQALPHLKTLRLHTRLPVVIPQRIDTELLDWLASIKLNTVLVVHVNHPNEIDEQLSQSLQKLRQLPIQLLNQAVLLKGINDEIDTQVELAKKCMANGVLPYYLHQLDHVTGNTHFHVNVETGHRLIEQMRMRLPGYLVPSYVEEIAGMSSKQPL